MMDMTVEEWDPDYVRFSNLKEWLNEANADGWVLHTLKSAGLTYDGEQEFLVVMYKPKKAATRAAEKWALTMGTTGGHANE